MCHSENRSSISRTRVLAAVIPVLVCCALGTPIAVAQTAGGDLGSIGGIMEQLQGFQSDPTLQRQLGRIRGASALDKARESSDKRLQGLIPSQDQTTSSIDRQGRPMNEAERAYVEQFCRDELSVDQQNLINQITTFSRVERDFCLRLGEVLFQHGYDLFNAAVDPDKLPIGSVPPNYILGIGDELVVTFTGPEGRTEIVPIDREGKIVLLGWQPLPAAGRTFSEFRRELAARTATTTLGTEVFVSLATIRAVSVSVLGDVHRPGQHQLTALSSVIDAITMAGGVKKTGSVRSIYVQRGADVFWFDAYDLLFSNVAAHDMTLFDGDRIVVPPLGATVAVTGAVKRPAIYELPDSRQRTTISEALSLAGGTLRPRGHVFLQIGFDESGTEQVVEHADPSRTVNAGDIILVRYGANIQVGSVSISGHVRTPGRRSLATANTVSQLVGDVSNLKPNPYMLFAALETTDPRTRARRFFPLNLHKVVSGQQDYALRDGDRLVVLSAKDIEFLSSRRIQQILKRPSENADGTKQTGRNADDDNQKDATAQPALTFRGIDLGAIRPNAEDRPASTEPQNPLEEGVATQPADCSGLLRLQAIVETTPVIRFAAALRTFDISTDERIDSSVPCPPLFDRHADLLPLALEHAVAANGEVRRPGAYPVVGETQIDAVIAVAGGLSREVDLTRIEISRFTPDQLQGIANVERRMANLGKKGTESVAVGPGDVIRFNAIFTDREAGPVRLVGELVRPGNYEIRRGEKLSELIARAGGLTEQAYPYGAIFTRERVKQEQQRGFQRAARELNASLAVAAVQRSSNVSADTLAALQQISQQLQSVEALGRVVIEADPAVLRARPEFDTVLEPGDRLFIPKRPNFVTVIGDVLNPGAMQFLSGSGAPNYIRQAGGYQQSADEDRVFVVFPNGSAEPLALSPWNFNPVQIPPGSSIVVPKDPTPFNLFTVVREGAGLISQLAVTAASLAVISRN